LVFQLCKKYLILHTQTVCLGQFVLRFSLASAVYETFCSLLFVLLFPRINLLVRFLMGLNRQTLILAVLYAKSNNLCPFFFYCLSSLGHIDFSCRSGMLLNFFMTIIALNPVPELFSAEYSVFLQSDLRLPFSVR